MRILPALQSLSLLGLGVGVVSYIGNNNLIQMNYSYLSTHATLARYLTSLLSLYLDSSV